MTNYLKLSDGTEMQTDRTVMALMEPNIAVLNDIDIEFPIKLAKLVRLDLGCWLELRAKKLAKGTYD